MDKSDVRFNANNNNITINFGNITKNIIIANNNEGFTKFSELNNI